MAAFPIPLAWASSEFRINLGEISAGNELNEPRITEDFISGFDDDDYRLLTRIPIRLERTDSGFVASFNEANIAIGGTTKADARQALEVEILDAFDDWTADETALGIPTREQLAVLKRYIAKT
jgi:hypothetical protein